MAPISLRGVEKKFGDVTAVASCDLDIDDHEFLVLVGPSGSGKTTLLRLIAGLEEATAGEIRFGDDVVNDVDVGDRDIAMVFQNYGLYPHMSVYGNMAFGLRRRKLGKAEIDTKVRDAAALLGIDAMLDRKPKQLSGGQRQRVALGRAIVRDPAVFLLDEPLSNLDAHLRVQMRGEILKVHRAVSATAVYVTHDQVEAMTMGDRIVVMSDGVVQQVGTPDELYDTPVNRFVGGFIGTPAMGFLTVERGSHDGSPVLQGPGVRLPLRDSQAAALPDGEDRFVVGIRPEHLRLTDSPDVDSSVTGDVTVIEPLGSEQHVVVDVAGQLVTAKLPREDKVQLDTTVTLTVPDGRCHVFDAETGVAYR